MAMNEDYLEFLSDFVNGLNIHDQLPVPVSSYNVEDEELVGDFVHWLLQYLGQKHCPLGLVAPVIRSVVEEMLAYCRNDPEALNLRDNSGQFSQLRLMQACTARANALCVRLHQDPALLAPPFLAPPPPHLVPVAAHGARSSQRRGMEDRHVVVHDFNAVFNVQDDQSASYYAVFDGHAGQDAAVFSAAHVHQFIAESSYYPADPVNALKDAILRTDELYLKKVKFESRFQSGTTAVCTLLRGRMLHVAWVGDSQAVLVKNGRAQMLVDPHKPKRPDEERRITEMGGLVLFHGMWRVNGQLAVSRAIGDPNFKPYVSAEAEVRSVALEGDEDLLIMASDGLLDFVTPQQAAAAALQQLQDNPDNINAVCSRLINLAKKQGSTDDISVIVAFLTEPRELAKRPVPSAIDMEDLVDTSPINGTNNQWFTDKPEEAKKAPSMPSKQNGGSGGFHHNLFDMGPETDVDRLDESDDDGSQDGARRNPFCEEVELRRIQQQQPEFDAARHPREETPTPPADEVPAVEGGSEENVAESGDESEEEWKYFSVEPSKPNNLGDQQLLPEHQQQQQQDNKETEENLFNLPTDNSFSNSTENPFASQTEPENPFASQTEQDRNPFSIPTDFEKETDLAEFERVTNPTEFDNLTDRTEFENLTNPTSEFENLTNPISSPTENKLSEFENLTSPNKFDNFSDFENVLSNTENLLPCKVGDFETLLASTREEEDSKTSKDEDNFTSKTSIDEDNFTSKASKEEENFASKTEENQLLSKQPLLIETQGVEEDDDNMDSQLNPDAAEFVPVSPTREVAPFGVPVVEQPSFGTEFPSAPSEEVSDNVNMFKPDFQHRPMDFIPQDEMMEEKENLVVKPADLDFASSPVLQDFVASPIIQDFAAPPELQDFDLPPVVRDFAAPPEINDFASEIRDFAAPPVIQDFAAPPQLNDFALNDDFSTEVQDFAAPISEQLNEIDNLQAQMTPDILNFCGTIPPTECEMEEPEDKSPLPLSPMDKSPFPMSPMDKSPQPMSPMDKSPFPMFPMDKSPQPMSPMDKSPLPLSPMDKSPFPMSPMDKSPQPLSPMDKSPFPMSPMDKSPQPMSPVAKEESMSEQEIVQTSVAQGPTFPVVENIITPDEDSSVNSAVEQNVPVPEPAMPVLERGTTPVSEQPEPTMPVLELEMEQELSVPAMSPQIAVSDLTQEVPKEVEALTELVDKLSVEPVAEVPVVEIAAVAAVGAVAAAAVTAAKTVKKATSPTKEKASSPTKEKAGSPAVKKTPSKPAAKTSPAKVPAAATKSSTVRGTPSTPKPAPNKVPLAPRAAAPLVKKTAPTTTTAAPKPRPAAAGAVPSTTRAPTRPASGLTSPTKPTAPRPKPATTATKTTEAKKPLTNGDAKPAPKRPVSASVTSKLAPRPTSAAPKPPTTRPATTLPAKTPPRPRPASAAVNGVAKPKVEIKTTASPRPATTTRRVLPPKPAATAAKLDTANKPMSRTATTKTTLTKTTVTKTAPGGKPLPVTRKPPVTKEPTKTSPVKVDPVNGDAPAVNGDAPAVNGDAPTVNGDAPVVNGDSHHEVPILIEAPSLVALE